MIPPRPPLPAPTPDAAGDPVPDAAGDGADGEVAQPLASFPADGAGAPASETVEPGSAGAETAAVDESVPADGAEPVLADATAAEPAPHDAMPSDATFREAPPSDPAASDPTPADVAVEEPVVEEPVRAGSDGDELVAGEPLAAGPADDDASSEQTATAEAATDDGPVRDEPVRDHGEAEQGAALSSDESTLVLDVPEVPAGEAADGEDPTPPEVRVEELTAAEESSDDEPVVDESASDASALDETAQNESALDAPALDEPALDEPATGAEPPVVQDEDSASAAATASDRSTADQPSSAADDASAVPVLALRNVTKSFGELRAVDAIDLTVPAGSFYGLVGPNGAGKTTTLSIIAGLLRADGGSVTINGVDASRRSREAKKLIGVLPDRLRTFDRLTGRQLLSYYGALRGLPAPLVESRTADLARAFDLVDALARPVSDYSAGMTKKVMLAGAMIHSPRLLVLDEPFEAVDPVSSGVILDILGSYVDHGGTVILSSHGMELVERVCSRVAVIVSGQVLAEGTVDEVRGEATLEQRFRELAGGLGDVEGLEWLHTFSA
ncbi:MULTISPECIES: ATP-binding cassette domain-containing protein [unclassified Microbacterium]|uniref:ATP-binding cassette domain-containing protein n=1 Tax=unclassified Microbacterium TaxID=2609290 RepID=UPI00210EEB78|nr:MULTISPECIES: ATP-binding cassette domain-containing protein [unclassified Microbacterium]